MASFNFNVDRLYCASAPLAFTLGPAGERVAIAPGESLVYRGLVELGGVPHYVFSSAGRHLYTPDRAGLDGLVENTEEGFQAS